MTVKWTDVSDWQGAVNDSYPYRVFAFRSNDGTYKDKRFPANYSWATSAIDRGRLDFFIVYAVYEPDGGNWVSTLMSMVGSPHPRMVVMIDVENWNGRITGDHSADINAGRARLAQWLGDSRRVIGYGNRGDLNNLWPNKGDAQLVVAAYGSNPSYPNKIAHQYTDAEQCAPFGSVDMNSADGVDVPTLMTQLGLSTPTPPAPAPEGEDDMQVFMATSDGSQGLIKKGVSYIQGTEGPLRPLSSDEYGSYVWWRDTVGVKGGNVPVRITEWAGNQIEAQVNRYGILEMVGGTSATDINGSRATGRIIYAADDIRVPGAVALTDAQLQTLEQGVVTALGALSFPVSDADKQAIAAAVRANIAANPLTAAPFEVK